MTRPRHLVSAKRLALSFALACAVGGSVLGDDSGAFRIGLTGTMMPGVNSSDAMAALTVWGNEIAAREQLKLRPQTLLFDNADEVRSAVDEGRIDLVLMSTEQYVSVGRPKYGQILLGARKGNVREAFVVLVKKGSAARLADLKGKTLLTIDGLSYDMSLAWLASELRALGLGTTTRHFASIGRATKVARGVLPVYFGQADACIVTRSAFNLMVELNPQVGTALEAIATSPPLVHAVAVLGNRLPSDTRPKLVSALLSLHTTPRGQQALAFFGFERLMLGEPDDLGQSIEIARANRPVRLP